MKKIICISVALLLSMVSCTKQTESTISDQPLPDGSVKIALIGESGAMLQTKAANMPPTDSETSDEYVRKIQVFFYNEANKLEAVRTYDAMATVNDEITWTSGQSEMTVNNLTDLDQPKTIYVVTNWLTYTDIQIGSTLSELTNNINSISKPLDAPSKAAPILMSGCADMPFIFHEDDQQAAKRATIILKRQQVKILFTLNIAEAFKSVLTQENYKVDPDNKAAIQVHNLPSASYITEQMPVKSPDEVTFFTADYAPLVRSADNSTWSYSCYSYENPILGHDVNGETAKLMSSTYFTVCIPLENAKGEVIDNYYRAYINDLEDTTNPHKTIRNYIYNISLTVVGFGLGEPVFESINALTKIENWVDVPLDVDLSGKDMTVNKTLVALKGNVMDKSLIIRATTDLDPVLTTSERLFSSPIYPDDMPPGQQGLKLGCESQGDAKSIVITIQNAAATPYTGGKATIFYIQYGMFKKRISVMHM